MRILQKNMQSQHSVSNLEPDSPRLEGGERRSPRGSSPYEHIMKYFESSQTPRARAQKFVVFILHGLEGNPFDMRHIRAAVIDAIPSSRVFIVNNNFKLTNEDLNLQARRLALEVREILVSINFFGGPPNADERSQEIIFVGHSLGGLVIREAVQYMQWAQKNLFALATLNTPHLGCLGNRFLVNTGGVTRHQGAQHVRQEGFSAPNVAFGLREEGRADEPLRQHQGVQAHFPAQLARGRLRAAALGEGVRD